jgi:lysophospholipase L1-like esterase
VKINPETASIYEIALGGCRDAASALKETLGTNTYAIKAVNTANGVCIAVVGNNNRSTVKAIERLEKMIDETAWDGVLALNVTDTLDYKYPKKISFYGDSITTYENISDSGLYNSTLTGQAVYYNTERMTRNNMLMTKDETWWGIVLSSLNAKLCVNNSYSGDATTSQYAMNRARNLHKDFMGKNENPDTIVVYFGINDYHATADSSFRANYLQLITIIKETYPDATVFCCTLLPRYVDEFKRIEAYNDSIRYVCEELDVELIDLYDMIGADYRAKLMYYTIEGCHPFKSGMKVMGDAVTAAIEKWYYGE